MINNVKKFIVKIMNCDKVCTVECSTELVKKNVAKLMRMHPAMFTLLYKGAEFNEDQEMSDEDVILHMLVKLNIDKALFDSILRNNFRSDFLPPSVDDYTEEDINENFTVERDEETGRIVKLNISGGQLTQQFPNEVLFMSSLKQVTIIYNKCGGKIPKGICVLKHLTSLALYNNELTGQIPTDIGELTNLKFLYLNNNNLVGTIPTEIGNLTEMVEMYLTGNKLVGPIPSEIGNMANLESFDFSSKVPIEDKPVPTELCQLKKLYYAILLDGSDFLEK